MSEPRYPMKATVKAGERTGQIVGWEWGGNHRGGKPEWLYYVRTLEGAWITLSESELEESQA